MQGHGKKSAASLSVVPGVLTMRRPEPIFGLTQEQCDLWRSIVNPLPADWFNDSNTPLLAEYVRAVDMTNKLAMQIEALLAGGDPEDINGSLDALLKMRDRESKRAMSLCTKMRMSQQSSYNALNSNTAKKKAGTSNKPWLLNAK